MAKQENLDMEKDKKLLQAILDSLQSDDLWDENIPREKALKEMKEPRYHYMKKNMTISGTKSNEKDTVMAGGDFKKTDAQNMLKDQTGIQSISKWKIHSWLASGRTWLCFALGRLGWKRNGPRPRTFC